MITSLPQKKPCILGESPHFDPKTRTLYWVDIYGKAIFRYPLHHTKITQFNLPEMVGHVIPTSAETALISMPSGIYTYQFSNQHLSRISELEPHFPNNRPNDGKCDPQGRLWVGTIDFNFEAGASSLYRLEPNGVLTQVLSGLTLANGLAWDTTENLFYFIDSTKQCVQKFDYHPKNGEITHRRIAFSCDQVEGLPDGMCIDPEGMLWIAFFDGGQVCRFHPNTGKVIQTIKLPTPYPTSCTWGETGKNQLFITSSSHLLTPKEKEKDTQSGLTFIAEIT